MYHCKIRITYDSKSEYIIQNYSPHYYLIAVFLMKIKAQIKLSTFFEESLQNSIFIKSAVVYELRKYIAKSM